MRDESELPHLVTDPYHPCDDNIDGQDPVPFAKLVRTLSPCEEGRNEKPNEVTEALRSLFQVLKGWAHDPQMGCVSCR